MNNGSHLPTPDDILQIHEDIEEAYDMTHTGTRAYLPEQKLQNVVDEAQEQEDTYERGAVLLRDLITTHVFKDGNKRTAWVTTRQYLKQHGEEPAGADASPERVLTRIQRFEVPEIAEWLRNGSIDEDRLEP